MDRKTVSNKNTRYVPSSIIDECYYLAALELDESLTYYSGFFIKGKLNQQTMEAALSSSLKIHHKCNYVLTQNAPSWKRWFRLFWEPHEVSSSALLSVLRAQDLSSSLSQEFRHYRDMANKHKIDISREPGIKIFLVNQKEDNVLIFAFHHAITDGRGAIDFIETYISEYNRMHFNTNTKRQPSREFTYFDNLFLPTWKQSFRIAEPFFSILRHQHRCLREPLIKIAPKTQSSKAEKMVVARIIEGEDLEKIMAFAKQKSVLFYDMLLAGLYFTVRKWNNRLGVSGSGRVSFYSTVSLRQRNNKSLGNFASGIRINLLAIDDLHKSELIDVIVKRRIFLLKSNAHLLPLRLLSILSLIPIPFRKWLLKWFFKGISFGQSRQLATMRVTNLGTLEVAHADYSDGCFLGDAHLEGSYFFPAVVDKVPLLVFLTCNKKVYLSLTALTSTFSCESGEEFLTLLVKELSEF